MTDQHCTADQTAAAAHSRAEPRHRGSDGRVSPNCSAYLAEVSHVHAGLPADASRSGLVCSRDMDDWAIKPTPRQARERRVATPRRLAAALRIAVPVAGERRSYPEFAKLQPLLYRITYLLAAYKFVRVVPALLAQQFSSLHHIGLKGTNSVHFATFLIVEIGKVAK